MVGDTMPNAIQDVRRNSQYCKSKCFVEIISMCVSKVNGPCINQDESVR